MLVQALEQYQELFLDAGALALRTKREYRNDLKRVIAFLTDQCGLPSPKQVTRVHLEAYLDHLDAHGYSGAARRRQYASIRSLFLKAAGISNASVHTFAVTQVQNHVSLKTVRELLGHASLDTTLLYIDLARALMAQEGARA